MATDSRNDPFRGFNFRVEIEGIPVAAFSEVSGLTADRDVVEYRVGTHPENSVTKLAGMSKFTNIMFKKGYVRDDTLWLWYQRIHNGAAERHSGSVVLMNEAHRDVMRWNFEQAWITKIEGPGLNASNNEVAVESMEMCHEGLTFELEAAA
jgi:phage tail-like protein